MLNISQESHSEMTFLLYLFIYICYCKFDNYACNTEQYCWLYSLKLRLLVWFCSIYVCMFFLRERDDRVTADDYDPNCMTLVLTVC